MGQNQSIKDKSRLKNKEYKELHNKIDIILEKYKKYIDDKDILTSLCKNIVLLEKKRLINYRNATINKKQYLLGIKHNIVKNSREEDYINNLCDILQKQYKMLIIFIEDIKIKTLQSNNYINALIMGPRCWNAPYIFDYDKCIREHGKDAWRGEGAIVPPPLPKDVEENQKWYNYFNVMIDTYIVHIQHLKFLLVDLDKNSEIYNINELENIIKKSTDNINYVANKIQDTYDILLKEKTYTKDEWNAKVEAEQQKKNEETARAFALTSETMGDTIS